MLTKKLDATLCTARAAHQREVDSLRAQLLANAAMHNREIALLTNQLTVNKVGNVVQLMREEMATRG